MEALNRCGRARVLTYSAQLYKDSTAKKVYSVASFQSSFLLFLCPSFSCLLPVSCRALAETAFVLSCSSFLPKPYNKEPISTSGRTYEKQFFIALHLTLSTPRFMKFFTSFTTERTNERNIMYNIQLPPQLHNNPKLQPQTPNSNSAQVHERHGHRGGD